MSMLLNPFVLGSPAPVIVSLDPADGAASETMPVVPEMVFDVAVVAGSGSAVLYHWNEGTFEWDVHTTWGTGALTIDGVTATLPDVIEHSGQYYIDVGAGFVVAADGGAPFAGLTGWDFVVVG